MQVNHAATSPQPTRPEARFRGHIRDYLNALVLAVLLPLMALAMFLATNISRSHLQMIEAQRLDIVNNIGFLIDREILATESALHALAVSPALSAGQLDFFSKHVQAAFPGGNRVVLMTSDGKVLASSQVANQSVPPSLQKLENLQAIFAGKAFVSGFEVGSDSKAPYFLVSLPVMLNDRVIYSLSVELGLDRLNSLFSEAGVKPQWLAAIADNTGRLLARNVGFDKFAGVFIPAEAREAASGVRTSGTFQNTSIDGIETSNAWQRSAVTGWTVFAAVPTRVLHAPLDKVYQFVAVVGFGLTALSLGMAYWLSERISGAVRNLESAARDVVGGRSVPQTAYAISEFDKVAKVFEYAGEIASERKGDEQKLRESEQRQRLALEAGAFATWDLDYKTGTSVWSPNLFGLLGYPPGVTQLVTRSMWFDRIHQDDRAAVAAEIEAASKERRTLISEYRIRHVTTNEVRWLRSNGRFYFDSDGTVRRSVGVVRDVTERKVLELELRENEARYKSALSVGGLGSWETDFAAGVRIWSPEAQALFGISIADGRGHVGGEGDEWVATLHPDDRHLIRSFRKTSQTSDSFPAEYRIVRADGTIRWLSGSGRVIARGGDGRCLRLVSVMTDVTEHKKAADHLRFLMREMSHRSKNLLAVIQSIAGQTMRTSSSKEDFQSRFEQRLQGLAASHDILVDQNWEGAALSHLVRRQLAPFVDLDSERLVVAGPDVDLNSTAAQAVGMALHELATNAVKYGALANAYGKISIDWHFQGAAGEPAPTLILTWVEVGGPTVQPPTGQGFGTAVVAKMAPNSVSGVGTLEYPPSGLRWTLTIPAALNTSDVEPFQQTYPAARRGNAS